MVTINPDHNTRVSSARSLENRHSENLRHIPGTKYRYMMGEEGTGGEICTKFKNNFSFIEMAVNR